MKTLIKILVACVAMVLFVVAFRPQIQIAHADPGAPPATFMAQFSSGMPVTISVVNVIGTPDTRVSFSVPLLGTTFAGSALQFAAAPLATIAGQTWGLIAQDGGAASGGVAGGAGGIVYQQSGSGGAASSGAVAGAGGIFAQQGGNGGAGSATQAAGAGGPFQWVGGSAGTNGGGGSGVGGGWAFGGGNGSDANGASAGGVGSTGVLLTGNGGACSATGQCGNGGPLTIGTGNGGTTGAGLGGLGLGGPLTLTTGAGSASTGAVAGKRGGIITIIPSPGGSGSAGGAAGPGGPITIRTGDGGTNNGGGGASSGALIIDVGLNSGVAAAGTISLGVTNSRAITIGNPGGTLALQGAITGTFVGSLNLAGAWSPESPTGIIPVTTNFLGPFTTTSKSGTFGTVSCSWSTPGTGTGNVVFQVFDSTGAAELCSCTLGLCTIAANVPSTCVCNTAFVVGHTYVARLKSTTNCSGTDPGVMACSVEILQ